MQRVSGSPVFLIFVALIILVIAGHNFYRYYVQKSFPLHVFTTCDPVSHSCFEADPNIGDPTFQSGTYEKVLIDATYAPSCLDEHTCTDFSCAGISGTCEITYCSQDALEDGESCTTGTSTETQ